MRYQHPFPQIVHVKQLELRLLLLFSMLTHSRSMTDAYHKRNTTAKPLPKTLLRLCHFEKNSTALETQMR